MSSRARLIAGVAALAVGVTAAVALAQPARPRAVPEASRVVATTPAATVPSGPSLAPSRRAAATSTRQATATSRPATTAQQRFEQLAAPVLASAPGPVSVAARDRHGNVVAVQDPTPALMASVAKVEILVTLLLQRRAAGGELSDEERELASAMITVSDNDAADELWETIGRQDGLDATHQLLGLTGTVTGPDMFWGLTTTTAADQLALLTALTADVSPLAAPDRAYVLSLMEQVADDQAWGVRTVGPGPLKDGWLEPDDEQPWVLNSVGIVTPEGHEPLEIVVLTSGWESFEDGVTAVESLARAAAAALEP